jgi:hypothetical protein
MEWSRGFKMFISVNELDTEEKKLNNLENEIKHEIKVLRINNPWFPVNHLTGKLANISIKRKKLLRKRKMLALRGMY